MSVKSLLIEKVSNGYVLTVEVKNKHTSELDRQTKIFNSFAAIPKIVTNLFQSEEVKT